MDVYFDRIKPLFDKSGESYADLERKICIPAKKINQWNAKYTKSYQKYIPQIASYFNVSTDYLLGNTDDPRPAGKKEEPAPGAESRPLYPPQYDMLTPEDRALVDNMIRSLAEKRSSD